MTVLEAAVSPKRTVWLILSSAILKWTGLCFVYEQCFTEIKRGLELAPVAPQIQVLTGFLFCKYY